MTTANKYKGEITRKFGDKDRTFRLTFDCIVKIERRTGKSVMVVARSIAEQNFSLHDISVILHEGLIGANGKFTHESVGDMIIETGLTTSAVYAGEVLGTIFTGDDTEDDSPLVKVENQETTTPSKNI